MSKGIHDDGGPSLPAIWRAIASAPLIDSRTKKPMAKQVPIVKWAKADSTRVRCREYVARYLRLVAPDRRKHG